MNEPSEKGKMHRPKLTQQTTPDDFLSFYWLKEELICFLRENNLPATGSKQDLTVRIAQFLATGMAETRPAQTIARWAAGMPKTFNQQSVIGPGWRCSQELRAFFEQEIGAHFHFDAVMRDFIHNGVGRTLAEAIITWKEAQQRGNAQEKEIAPQFEYNRHIREYFKIHPGAKLKDAIMDWKEKKKERRNTKIVDFEPKVLELLPVTCALLQKANLTVHPGVSRIVLHGSRGLAGNYRPNSDIDLSLIVDVPPQISQSEFEPFLHSVSEVTQSAWQGAIELDMAVVFETSNCALQCFNQTAWHENICKIGGVDCFGLYKVQKGFNGLVTNAGVQVKRMVPCVQIWQRS